VAAGAAAGVLLALDELPQAVTNAARATSATAANSQRLRAFIRRVFMRISPSLGLCGRRPCV
jgi:hypothetical protein